MNAFYFGNGGNGTRKAQAKNGGAPKLGLKPQLEHKGDEIDARDISRIWIGTPEGGEPVFARVGRYSPFVEQGDRTASLPDETPPDEVTLDAALKLLDQAAQGEDPLGTDAQAGKPVYLKVGRFGPYVQLGTPDDEEKPKNASLLKGMDPKNVDLATALVVVIAAKSRQPSGKR